ncbi:DUF397 domain-containing protein [Thermomonospora echinospora]|nr:DUF397 domain-containing protein [Thermomonospora echinospora]
MDVSDRAQRRSIQNKPADVGTVRKTRGTSPDGDCVEVGISHMGAIGVRDTKQNGAGPALEFTRPEWAAFLSTIRSADPRR